MRVRPVGGQRAMTLPLTILRVAVATLLFIHGASRVLTGGVAPFGEWLDGQGFPAGLVLAWTITLLELLATPVLAAGRFVVPVAAWFVIQLGVGIAMIHGREGWFVVGGGRNGAEYSVLLITCLLVLILAARQHDTGRAEPPTH